MSEPKPMTEQAMLDAISEHAASDQQYSHQTILALVRSLLGQVGPDGVHLTAVEVSGLYDLLGLIENHTAQ